MNGIFDNSGENSNETPHPGGMFSENTFRGVSFLSLSTEFPEISVPFVRTYKCQTPHGSTSEKEC